MPKPASIEPRRSLEEPFTATPARTILETFQDTLRKSFDSMLKKQLGPSSAEEVYNLLAMKGVQRSEIPAKFDRVVEVLNEAFGRGARVLIHETVVNLYAEYSIRPKPTIYDFLTDQITHLKNKVAFEGLKPKYTHNMRLDMKSAVRE